MPKSALASVFATSISNCVALPGLVPTKTRGHFPSDDAASKLIWLARRNIIADRSRAAKE